MKIKALAQFWESKAKATLTEEEYSLRLPVEDAAKISALAEMYPKRSMNEILSDLVSASLEELETSFPYQAGSKIVAQDEMGDPLYEDIGPTPQYLDLSKKYSALLKKTQAAANQ